MQWPDASFEAVAVIEPQVDKNAEQETAASGIAALFGLGNVPVGLDLPCTDDPELFFAEAPADVEAAKGSARAAGSGVPSWRGHLSDASRGASGEGNCSCAARWCRGSGRVAVPARRTPSSPRPVKGRRG